MEDNLEMRAASIRRDEGEGVIPGDLRPPWLSCGAIQMVSWVVGVVGGVWTEWDEKFSKKSHSWS